MIVANWKMNGSLKEVDRFIQELISSDVDLVLCLPFVFLEYLSHLIQNKNHKPNLSKIKIGAQDCSAFIKGSYTGDVSASMLKEIGCQYVIIGHSERRTNHKETNEIIRNKIECALSCNLIPIICIGEQDPTNKKQEINEQLSSIKNLKITHKNDYILAYEPVYAIGAKNPPSTREIEDSINIIKLQTDSSIKLLYGGAVDENNTKEIFSINEIGGLLVGRASLSHIKINLILKEIDETLKADIKRF